MLGVSFDSVEDQKTFAEENGFEHPLLSDGSKDVGAAYEVLREEGDPYYEYGLPKRISYLIEPGGEIARAYDLAGHDDVSRHAAEVLEDLPDQQGG